MWWLSTSDNLPPKHLHPIWKPIQLPMFLLRLNIATRIWMSIFLPPSTLPSGNLKRTPSKSLTVTRFCDFSSVHMKNAPSIFGICIRISSLTWWPSPLHPSSGFPQSHHSTWHDILVLRIHNLECILILLNNFMEGNISLHKRERAKL